VEAGKGRRRAESMRAPPGLDGTRFVLAFVKRRCRENVRAGRATAVRPG